MSPMAAAPSHTSSAASAALAASAASAIGSILAAGSVAGNAQDKQRGGFLTMLTAKLEHIEPLLLSDDFSSSLPSSSNNSSDGSNPSSPAASNTASVHTHRS